MGQSAVDAPTFESSPRADGRSSSAVDRVAPRLRAAWRWLPTGRSLPDAVLRTRHRWLTGLLWVHALVLPLYAISRGYSASHSALEAGLLGALAAGASLRVLPRRARAALTALGLITASAVLVHFSGGLIEAHFHFFVVVLILAVYEDWIPFLISLGYVVLHHGAVGQLSPELVYNHPDALAHPWKWAAIHGAFIAAAAAGAVVSWRLNENARVRVAEATARAVRSNEANAMKSRFIATASHELRTPLTSIGGFAATLLHRWEHTADEDKLKMLGIIEAQSFRLRHLIEDLLVLSAVESGNVPVREALVDVASAALEVVEGLDADGEVAVDVPRGLVARVDERHLAQILVNLVGNALKYGAPPVRISASPSGAWIELAVSDGGPGVPESFRPQLFETFTRAADTSAVEGSGLGLSIVRGLAQANGGEVGYEPNDPRGARFRVRLPRPLDGAVG